MRSILFLTQGNKIHIFKPSCNFFLFCEETDSLCKKKVGNDVINIVTSEDVENKILWYQV